MTGLGNRLTRIAGRGESHFLDVGTQLSDVDGKHRFITAGGITDGVVFIISLAVKTMSESPCTLPFP